MDNFFEQLFNAVYREGQKVLIYFFGPGDYRSASIRFGGFQPSYNWYGKTSLGFDKVGPLEFSTKTIYLNVCFMHYYLGLVDWTKYDFPKFVNTIAHEITHCLIADYGPKQTGKHDGWFLVIAYFVEAYLWDTNEIKILAQLSNSNRSSPHSLKFLKLTNHSS